MTLVRRALARELLRRAGLPLALLAAACKVGPDYARPEAPLADAWLGAPATSDVLRPDQE